MHVQLLMKHARVGGVVSRSELVEVGAAKCLSETYSWAMAKAASRTVQCQNVFCIVGFT